MGEKRKLRLVALTLAAAGIGGTALAATGFFDGYDGALWFPVAAIIGISSLINLRPRR